MMAMANRRSLFVRNGVALRLPAAIFAGALLAACGSGPSAEPVGEARPGTPDWPLPSDEPIVGADGATCDPSITVRADGPALIVRDPAALAGFSLKRVVEQLIDRSGMTGITAEELVWRLFDTENDAASAVFADNIHCDSGENGAFKNGGAVNCPRAEGALASSPGLFTPGHPDYFAPVAVINRFDLTSQAAATCGEYRIIFAKQSGLTDPNDRLFLIFEGALENPSFTLGECKKVQEYWRGNEAVEKDPAKLAARLESFFFDGIPGFAPLVDPNNFGLVGNDDDPYNIQHGQIRVSQRMQDPWELREFRFRPASNGEGGPAFRFSPTTVKNNPLPELFDPAVQTDLALSFRNELSWSLFGNLATTGLARINMQVSNVYNGGESALSGEAQTDYVKRAMSVGGDALLADLNDHIEQLGMNKACPPSDPMTAESIIRRATTQSCAGCHAPERFLGDDRKIGCGLVWPRANGEVHIDEKGQLSPALTDVFLPRRASVVATFLQSCDMAAIWSNLQPGGIPIPD